MKILRFDDDQIGILKNGGRVVDVSEAVSHRAEKGPQRAIEDVIENFDGYREKFEQIAGGEEGVPLESVNLLVPIPRPGKCLAAFLNYMDRPGRTPETLPMEFFYKDPVLLGPGEMIELVDIPEVKVFHAEAELAFIVGKPAKNVSQENAMDYVFGYVPFFDVSVRGIVRYTRFLTKGLSTHGPCGPWIATKDEIPDPHALAVQSWVNGEARQDYNTKDMAHKIPAQIAWLSRFVRLQPGDLVATGTHHEGLGPINDEDVLEIEIEKIGKAHFPVKGYGARKEAEHRPMGPQPLGGPADGNPVTRV
ncbi:fumarylacetoacetate hydrolase family protein [Nitrospinota bacterium]